jgi:hypothetical protein
MGVVKGRIVLPRCFGRLQKCFHEIEVFSEPKRVYSSFVRGIESLPVRIPG